MECNTDEGLRILWLKEQKKTTKNPTVDITPKTLPLSWEHNHKIISYPMKVNVSKEMNRTVEYNYINTIHTEAFI